MALDVVGGAERGAQILGRVIEAVDVRPHKANAVFAPDRDDFLLSCHIAGFGKARGYEHRAGNFLLADFDQRLRHELGRDREHRDVDDAGDVLDALVGLAAHDLAGGRIDRIDLSLVAAVDQVFHDRVADLPIFAGGTDDGNRVGLHDPVHVAHDIVVAGPITGRRRREIDHDAHVGGNGALAGREHRVQIHLGNVAKIRDELGDVLNQRGQRLAMDRIGAADGLQYFSRGDAVEHRQRVFARRGSEAKGDVLQHLDQNSTEAEGDQLAERRIGDRADDDLLAAGEHLLHLDAEELRLGIVFLGVGHDGRKTLLDFIRAFYAHQHAACLGLVEDLGRYDLEHYRKAHAGGDLCRLRSRGRNTFLRHGDTVGVADQLAFRSCQRGAAFRLDLVENSPDRGFVLRHVLPLDWYAPPVAAE